MSIDESWKEEGLPVLHMLDTNRSEFDKAHCFFSVGYLAGLKRAQESMKQNLNSFLKD